MEGLGERGGLERPRGWILKGPMGRARHWRASGRMKLVGGTRTLLTAGRRWTGRGKAGGPGKGRGHGLSPTVEGLRD